MTARNAVVALASLTALALAQETGAVVGVVRNSVTNEPIMGAHVRIMGARTVVATSGPDGRYRLNAPEGKYKLDAYLDGYVGPSKVQDLDVRFTGGLFTADTVLEPLAILRGRILDAQGNGIRDAAVSLTSIVMRISRNAYTDREGRFIFRDLEPGACFIQATAPRKSPDTGAPRTALLRTYYPSGRDRASATEIQLVPGDRNSNYDIRLIEERVQSVRGVVRNVKGEPVGGAMVVIQPASEIIPLRIQAVGADTFGFQIHEPLRSVQANSQGDFEFRDVPAGQWSIHADNALSLRSAVQNSGDVLSGLEQVAVGKGDVSDVNVTVELPFDLLVHVEGQSKLPEPFLALQSTSAGVPLMGLNKRDQTAPGLRSIHGVYRGTYAFNTPVHAGQPCIASILVGGKEALGREVLLAPGAPVQMVLGSPGTIRGNVDLTGGGLGSPVAVLLFPPSEAELEPVTYLWTDKDGGFAFASLRPATYRVVAVRNGQPASLSDAELRSLRAQAKSVRVESGASVSVTPGLR